MGSGQRDNTNCLADVNESLEVPAVKETLNCKRIGSMLFKLVRNYSLDIFESLTLAHL